MKRSLLALLLGALVMAASPARTTVYMIGDSTMADRPQPETNPERGWGQMLPRFFDKTVSVRNFAVNGRSTKSFIDEGKWAAVLAQLQPGDYVLIQFGHNDEKTEDPARYTNPYTGYRRNLERFVAESRAKGATPVLFSSIVRRHWNAQGVLEDTHGAYPLVTREVARDLRVPFVDLQLASEDLVREAGPEASKRLYAWSSPGEFAMYPQGHQDDTHLSAAGAEAVARLAAEGLARTGLPLARHVRLAGGASAADSPPR
jgi:lysophospholipase L1-like esterase